MRSLRLLLVFIAAILLCARANAGAYEQILADAEQNRSGAVFELLQLGLDVNTAAPDGTTLLMIAARNGNLELLNGLLKMRANHLIRNRFGDTALMMAALKGHLAVVERLLELGGPQENRDGWTPLQYAAFGSQVEVARHLLAKGAKVDEPAPNGQTALMLAAGNGTLEMVKVLVANKADMTLKDRDGNTAKEIAVLKKNVEVAQYLESLEPGNHEPPVLPKPANQVPINHY